MAFTIKQNDTRRKYTTTLTRTIDGVTSNADLTNITTVKFKMRKTGTTGAPKINATMTVTDTVNGAVEYVWQPGDLSVAGTFDVEFELTGLDGGIETIPNDSYNTVIVKADLDT